MKKSLITLGLYLCVFLLFSIHYGGAAHFRNLLVVSVKRPTAYLAASQDVFEKQNAPTESQSKLVKQLQVLQEIIIRVSERHRTKYRILSIATYMYNLHASGIKFDCHIMAIKFDTGCIRQALKYQQSYGFVSRPPCTYMYCK